MNQDLFAGFDPAMIAAASRQAAADKAETRRATAAKNDLTEIGNWLDAGRIEQFDLYAGEIFPGSYGDEYEQMLNLCEAYGARLIVAKNHSKVTLACNTKESYYITIESSANVNTNPRIEQSAIHCGKDLHAFYLEFFGGIKSIDKASTAH